MSEATDAADTAAEGGRKIPDVYALTYGQYAGTHCVWCGKLLTSCARQVGISRGQDGVHVLDAPVYAGPCCPPETPPAGSADPAGGYSASQLHTGR
jgi:hypothetical protein